MSTQCVLTLCVLQDPDLLPLSDVELPSDDDSSSEYSGSYFSDANSDMLEGFGGSSADEYGHVTGSTALGSSGPEDLAEPGHAHPSFMQRHHSSSDISEGRDFDVASDARSAASSDVGAGLVGAAVGGGGDAGGAAGAGAAGNQEAAGDELDDAFAVTAFVDDDDNSYSSSSASSGAGGTAAGGAPAGANASNSFKLQSGSQVQVSSGARGVKGDGDDNDTDNGDGHGDGDGNVNADDDVAAVASEFLVPPAASAPGVAQAAPGGSPQLMSSPVVPRPVLDVGGSPPVGGGGGAGGGAGAGVATLSDSSGGPAARRVGALGASAGSRVSRVGSTMGLTGADVLHKVTKPATYNPQVISNEVQIVVCTHPVAVLLCWGNGMGAHSFSWVWVVWLPAGVVQP